MKCDLQLQQEATVHLTEIVDDQMSEMHLCENARAKKCVQMEQQFRPVRPAGRTTDFGKQTKTADKVDLKCPDVRDHL
ncbi:MAG: hypothetical protein H6756_00665 [Candidatus Omnitrophica bacterium]|nr:hypothetical protein [Candidatus Omnitrophota bacterium]